MAVLTTSQLAFAPKVILATRCPFLYHYFRAAILCLESLIFRNQLKGIFFMLTLLAKDPGYLTL